MTEHFKSREDAIAAMIESLESEGEEYIDNERFAFIDDAEEIAVYRAREESGCCGFHDAEVVVAGRAALVGCNYGH